MITKIYRNPLRGLLFIISYLFFSVALIGCADLEQTSLSSIDRDNFYSSKQDIETAINGIY